MGRLCAKTWWHIVTPRNPRKKHHSWRYQPGKRWFSSHTSTANSFNYRISQTTYKKSKIQNESESEGDEDVPFAENDDSDGFISEESNPEVEMCPPSSEKLCLQKRDLIEGDYVLTRYENAVYPGKVIEIENDTVLISAMVKCGSNWKWPEKPDSIWYFYKDIKQKIEAPVQISKREIFKVHEIPT